jgi:DNA-directed RNA polymerase specialized sigma24 family protein
MPCLEDDRALLRATKTPLQLLLEAEERQLLLQAVGRLPEPGRAVMDRYLDGHSFAKIGRQTGRTAKAAEMCWYRAVNWLRHARRADVA